MIEPEDELSRELLTVVNRYADRLSLGSQFGSLIAVARAVLHNPHVSRPATSRDVQFIVAAATRVLMSPPRRIDSVDEMLRGGSH